jgi:carbon starvation protein
MSLLLLSLVIASLILSYRYYASRKVEQEIEPGWSRSTPARRYSDGEEFMPSSSSILAGFQFKSTSLDMIIGPVIAIQFGWLPAVLWLIIGAIFFGWVQDYLSAIMSMRAKGKTVVELIESTFGMYARPVIQLFLLIYLLIILGQFGIVLSTLLGLPNVAPGIFFILIAAILAGQLIYRWQTQIWIATLISVGLAGLGILANSSRFFQELVAALNQFIESANYTAINQPIGSGSLSTVSLVWIMILMGICFVACILPIWRIAVPLNYVSAWVVLLSMSLAIGGLIVGIFFGSIDPNFELPALVTIDHPNLGPIWPILFVTLSSGAVSGWHAMVSSFSTSRQVEKEPNLMPISTGAMYTETILVLIVIIFAATFGVSAGLFNADQEFTLIAGPASVLASGMSTTLSKIGFSPTFGASLSAFLLTIMGLTVLQLVVRYARMISADLLKNSIPAFENRKLSALLVIILAFIIIVFGVWQWLWVLFAGANMLLAGLILLLATTWMAKQGKSYYWTLWPALFLLLTSLAALIYSSVFQALYQGILVALELDVIGLIGNMLTVLLGIFFILAGIYLSYKGWHAFNAVRRQQIQYLE